MEHEPIVTRAFETAKTAHHGVLRKDGSEYITHPLEVVRIMYEEWGIHDPEMLSAAFLHDTVEDTSLTLNDIETNFGKAVADLVEGVSKFRSEKGGSSDHETVRKIFDKNLIDPRVSVLKLADRLHNMRTMEFMPLEKRRSKSQETLDVYSPLAESLGMWIVKTELENLSFQYTDPENFRRYSNLFRKDPRVKSEFVLYMRSYLENILNDLRVNGHIFERKNSLVRLKDKKQPFKDINDVISFRMVIKGDDERTLRNECYKVLGAVREEFKNIEDQDRFDDFYASPRYNKYSAIQVTVERPEGVIEIAITSEKREDYNNWGVVSLIRKGEKSLKDHALKLVFTPSGQVKFLTSKATGWDLAYLISDKMGATATHVLINGKKFPISTVLPNGAEVEVIVGPDRIAPKKSAVLYLSPSAKKKAEKQFLEEAMQKEEAKGRKIVEQLILGRGILELNDLIKINEHAGKLVNLLYESGSKRSLGNLYRQVALKAISETDLIRMLEASHITKENLGLTSISIEGEDEPGLLTFFTSQIEKFGGNIRYNIAESDRGEGFKMRFVVEKLIGSEKELKEVLESCDKFKRLVIS